MINIPIALKQAISKNNLITFIGAGLSYNLKNTNGQLLKGWKNLVREILLDLNNEYDVGHLLPLVDRYDPIKILDLIESDKSLPLTKIYYFTKEFLDLDIDKNNFELHKNICKLTNKIITTNYDTAFEIAMPSLRKYTAYKGKNYELTTHKEPNAKLLFKLHGTYEDSDSMVLFPSNYRNLYNNDDKDAEHSLLVFKNIIHNKSLLIIGAGMGDFQINNIFRELKHLQGKYPQPHFIITSKDLDSSLDFLTPIKIDNYKEINNLLIQLIDIKSKTNNQIKSNEIEKLQLQLEKAKKKIKMLEKKVNPSKDKLLEREALKYFKKGLQFSLEKDYLNSIENYKISTELKPDFHDAFYNWGTSLGKLALKKEGKTAEQLFQLAFEKFQKATDLKSDYYDAFYNWGTNLGKLALKKEGKTAEQLFQLAFEKFQKATDLKPDYHEAFYNWGTYLGRLAQNQKRKKLEKLYYLAFEKFEQAVAIKSDYHEAFYNWGTYLGRLAQTKKGKDAEHLFLLAFEKFEQATTFKPNFQIAFCNWGTYLGELAHTKNGKDAEHLFLLAFEKFQKATALKLEDHDTFNNWGSHLLSLAQIQKGNDAEKSFLLAEEKLKKAISLGGHSYNLSCLYAARKQKENAIEFLKKSLKEKAITVDYVLQDDDWSIFKKDKEFIQLIEAFKSKEE